MSLGLRDPYERRKRQRRWTVIRTLLVLTVIAIALWIAYGAGRQVGQAQIDALQHQLDDSRITQERLEAESGRLAAVANNARQAETEWRQRYERDVPDGEMAELLAQARQRLEEGVELSRLAFVISAVERERDCRDEPVTRRFLVRTPLHRGGNDVASFAEGLFTVTASGPTAVNADGNPEAWFDPSAILRLTVTKLGGEVSQFEGQLPLHFSVVHDGSEHLFAAQQGENRGFLRVTHDLCAFP
ncbi:MAG TPA: type II secretion system protein [Kiloniellales bacterium]|nr:type II secretion system protein [Kiloniellales bacterium]